MQAQIYIVRIYRRNGDTGPAGVVEVVRSGERQRFQSVEELRRILGLPSEQRLPWRARRKQPE